MWKVTAQLAELDIAHGYVGGVDIIGYKMIEYHWDDARSFIQECLQQTESQNPKIVVHCAAGTNRSALIAGAAMIAFSRTTTSKDASDKAFQSKPNEFNFLDVIRILKKNQRGVVLNNVWFIQQLAEFAQRQGRLGPRPSGYTDEPLRKSELVF